MRLRVSGLKETIAHLKAYRASLAEKQRRMMEALASIGIDTARVRFAEAQYDGDNDVVVSPSPEWVGEDRLYVTASGGKVLFIEFGSGTIGYGHELAEQFGYGPGTWSDDESKGGKGHWQSENGWYYEHGKKSIGNPPARAMYEASKDMRNRILEIAREVYGGD